MAPRTWTQRAVITASKTQPQFACLARRPPSARCFWRVGENALLHFRGVPARAATARARYRPPLPVPVADRARTSCPRHARLSLANHLCPIPAVEPEARLAEPSVMPSSYTSVEFASLHVLRWRNRQTHQLDGLAPASAWRSKLVLCSWQPCQRSTAAGDHHARLFTACPL